MISFRLLLVALLVLADVSKTLSLVSCKGPSQRQNCAMAATLKERQSSDAIRRDIDELRKEALERFDKLSIQMEKLKEGRSIENNCVMDSSTVIPATNTETSDVLEGELSRQHKELQDIEDSIKKHAVAGIVPVPDALSKIESSQHLQKPPSLDLLDDTRWKIVFNIGRESGTWMPLPWGTSGDRLLFQVEIDFTSEPLYDQDDFFQSTSGTSTKRLDVVNAFLIPRGVGSQSVGRRPVSCKTSGGYKVCRGQGPMGTDLLRLYVELTEDLLMPDHESDVFCPKGRIYATCGYFMMHDSREPGSPKMLSPKEQAQSEHREAVINLESFQFLLDSDDQIFSIHRLKKMKDVFDAKKRVEEASKKLILVRQREPEKSQLRLSKRLDVGLSKEGGVCYKVQKGLTTEYHILGKMEVGCVDDHKSIGTNKNEELI